MQGFADSARGFWLAVRRAGSASMIERLYFQRLSVSGHLAPGLSYLVAR
jgi:hypothetical protein